MIFVASSEGWSPFADIVCPTCLGSDDSSFLSINDRLVIGAEILIVAYGLQGLADAEHTESETASLCHDSAMRLLHMSRRLLPPKADA